MADPRPLTRETLAKFLPDQESIRRFERLFYVAGDLTPADIALLTRLAQEASIDANTAQATAQSALDQLAQVIQDAAIGIGAADGKAVQALDLLANIAKSLELLATAPAYRAPLVLELADAGVASVAAGNVLIYDSALKQWRNAFLSEGANVDITNADGSITIAVAGAPPIGSAGGVLSGTYPNPGFAVDMATQAELDAAIATREPTITAGTTAQYWRGDKSWQDFFTSVRAATLTGLSTATNAVITAADTVLSALGKLQKQISDNLTTLTSHTGNTSNPHSTTAAQVGADPSGTATSAVAAHVAAANPHTQYGLKSGKLNQFAATTSAELAGVISDETGSGKLVFDTSPTLTTPKATTTVGVGNATPSASGAGVSFPATQSASTDPNTLDDYEEGTFSCAVGTTSGILGSFGSAACTYTKVGRHVFVNAKISGTGMAVTPVGYIQFTGMPFTASVEGAGAYGSTSISSQIAGTVVVTGTEFWLYASNNSATTSSIWLSFSFPI